MASGKWHQGTYEVVNKEKYLGNSAPVFRSSWEKRTMYYLDHNENIIKWGSEIITIPYFYTIDSKVHKYIVDFYAEVKTKNNKITKMLIEVKPSDQVDYPKMPKKKTQKALKNFKHRYLMVEKNKCKWSAAEQYCKQYGYEFKIITEKELFS
jgi:hypothetical protein